MLIRTTQDEELAVTQWSAGLPSPQQVTELLAVEFARAGYEVDAVAIDARTRRITVTADGDRPLDLDTATEMTSAASTLHDDLDTGDEAYFLEVTSPGVDRPLTTEKHFRRARGRLIDITLADGGTVSGRLGALDGGGVDLIVRDARNRSALTIRQIPLADIRQAVVQVEFSPPSARELDLVRERELGSTGETEAGA